MKVPEKMGLTYDFKFAKIYYYNKEKVRKK